MAPPSEIHEFDISLAWADGRVPGDLRLTDGRSLQVIYRGVWSNSDGPDFRNAMVAIDGKLQTGSIEIHVRSSLWRSHGHDANADYDDVILHVVLNDDIPESARTHSGRILPTLILKGVLDAQGRAVDERAREVLASLGNRTCLPTLGRTQPGLVRKVLRERGWKRLVEKSMRFSQELQVLTAPEVLYRGLLDALGFSSNRKGMASVGESVSLQLLESISNSGEHGMCFAILFGVAGFLPLPPVMVEPLHLPYSPIELEQYFSELRSLYDLQVLGPETWSLNRVRPANHPLTRLASLASLIERSTSEGLFERFLSLPLDQGKSWNRWLSTVEPAIGEARRKQIIVNVLAPFLSAYADVARDEDLAEAIAGEWEQLPGNVSDRIARSTRTQIVGAHRFPIRLALEEQGLHEIYRSGCSTLSCFECPIARLAVQHEDWRSGSIGRSET